MFCVCKDQRFAFQYCIKHVHSEVNLKVCNLNVQRNSGTVVVIVIIAVILKIKIDFYIYYDISVIIYISFLMLIV